MATPSPTITGQTGAHEQPQRYGWDESGPYLVRTWHGTRAEIVAQYVICIAAGATGEVKQGIGTDILEARYSEPTTGPGSPETVINTWEFFANVIEKDVLQADLATINAISDADRNTIQKWTDPDNEPSLSGTAQTVYRLMSKGVKSVRVNQPVLRHTQTVGDSYSVKASLTNVGKVYTTAQLQSAEDLPSDVLFNLPSDTSNHTGMVYGWLKMHPTVRLAARQKTQIEQEWEYGLYSTTLYTQVT